jgi:hypothetical protein
MNPTVHVLLGNCDNAEWAKNLIYDSTIMSDEGIPHENRGNVAYKYLEYIITNYDKLSDYTIFVDGSRNAWYCKENMDEKINKLQFVHDYYNINDAVNWEKMEYHWSYDTYEYIPETIHAIFDIIGEHHDINNIYYKQCSQFYVKKDNILRHSKDVYMRLYGFLINADIESWLTSRGFEYTWHIIFTGNNIDKP